MADIIESSDLAGDMLMKNFKQLVNFINKKYAEKIQSPLTITLGDEFQGVIVDSRSAMEIIFAMEEYLIMEEMKYKLRYVLNYGPIDTPVNPKRAHEMLGSGLTQAREKLNLMKKDRSRFLLDVPGKKTSKRLNKLLIIYQSIVDDWTIRQQEVATAFIKYIDYKKVAEKLNKDVSLAWKLEKSLKIKEYFELKSLILDMVNDEVTS